MADTERTSKRILIAEDEGLIALYLERVLIRQGYDVVGMVATGEEAIRVADAERPDLALMDIKLAGALDGIETATQLRERFDIPADEKKARGLQLSGVLFEEMKELSRNNCDMLMSRVGRYPARVQVRKAKSCVLGNSNAPDRDHWLCKLAREERPDGWWFGIQPPGVVKHGGVWKLNAMGENVKNLQPDYYSRLIAGRKDSWIRKNLFLDM